MLSRRQASKRIGDIGEKFACKVLGKHIHPNLSKLTPKLIKEKCDILQGTTKIEVKTSNLLRRVIPPKRGQKSYTWYGYQFKLLRQQGHADFFFLVCLGENSEPVKAFNIPAFLISTRTVTFLQNSKVFDEFLVFPYTQTKETSCTTLS